MSISRIFKSIAIILAVMVSFSVAAKEVTGKVRYKLGETFLIDTKGKEKPIAIGNKVKQSHKIRTGIASQVIVGLPDGSTISVEENSLVEFSKILAENGKQTSVTDIKAGKIRFDAQKQTAGSTMQFKTGTATAAIRGTDGAIGLSSKGTPIATLRNGRLEITIGKKTVGINGGQTAIPNGDDFVVMDLASSGNLDFLNEIDKLLSDSTKTLDAIKDSISKLDVLFKQKVQSIKDSVKCKFSSIPDTVKKEILTVTGTCPNGISVELGGQRFESIGSALQFTLEWDKEAEGPKKIPVTCYAGKVAFECATLNTFYMPAIEEKKEEQNKTSFDITTPSPVRICESGAVTVEGSFDKNDTSAVLLVKLGAYTSPNLVPLSAEGKWTHSITINDQKGNWNEKNLNVEFIGKDGKISKSIELDIDKTCGSVNLGKPLIMFQRSDSIRCDASFSLSGINNDIVILKTSIDGTPLKETFFDKDSYTTIRLSPGLHNYTLDIKDQAGNKSSVSKKLGCYPKNQAMIKFNKGNVERLRLPPPAPNNISDKLYKNMSFSITGIPSQDPSHIQKIVVKQGTKNLLLLEGEQINDLNYDSQVELTPGEKTNIDVYVFMKNGKQLHQIKTYEVR